MSEDELKLIDDIRRIFESRHAVGCTACKYCMPCPFGVDIPEVFKYYNKVSMLEKHWLDKSTYQGDVMGRGKGADKCTKCGVCEPKCPQGIKIPDELENAQAVLTAK
jgi:predicted aldo/keto reductase-like oxidoreductase